VLPAHERDLVRVALKAASHPVPKLLQVVEVHWDSSPPLFWYTSSPTAVGIGEVQSPTDLVGGALLEVLVDAPERNGLRTPFRPLGRLLLSSE
jgi:hypothetical protein